VQIRTPQALGATVRGQRQKLKMTQATLAEAAGVSRAWLTEFERGKPTVELGRVLAVVAALGLTLEVRIGDPPAAPAGKQATGLHALLEEYDKGDGDD
jgi:HTH-type transcriptional regulator/antitoxin HipB